MAETTDGFGIDPSHIIVTGYPDLTTNDDGSPCSYLSMTSDEMTWAHDFVIPRLDDTVAARWSAHGAQYFDTRPLSARHGICANDRWFNQIGESITAQGIDGTTPSGAFTRTPRATTTSTDL